MIQDPFTFLSVCIYFEVLNDWLYIYL